MLKGSPQVLGLASLLLVTACDHIPYYNESLDLFSWSRYDPEVNAIEGAIPPPGNLGPAPMRDHGAPMESPGAALDPALGGPARPASPTGATMLAANVVATSPASTGRSATSAPLVGIRNSVGPSVTWRSTRGTP